MEDHIPIPVYVNDFWAIFNLVRGMAYIRLLFRSSNVPGVAVNNFSCSKVIDFYKFLFETDNGKNSCPHLILVWFLFVSASASIPLKYDVNWAAADLFCINLHT